MAESVSDSSVQCPVCAGLFEPSSINRHLDACLQSPSDPGPPAKKPRINSSDSRPSAVFSMFQSRPRASEALAEDSGESAAGSAAPAAAVQQPQCPAEVAPPAACSPRALRLKNQKPLAELLRPSTLEEYFGQNKLIGEQTLLRSLLKSQEIPSLILWGPPGCGKTTLAHIIASSIKQKGTGRFVTLSATSASVSDVREVIKQAQNELRLCKRKTVLFIDEIHRFNKSQQDTFLPHVECGTITLIGATTENPSFQVNSALLSRCRVLVLERLSVEAVGSILRRAVDFLDLRILDSEERHSSEICSEKA
ncbi:ATPase WRNIP1 isoform X1 [Danio rerio]|uniref:ATPase WRNIP1 isoform X1 n=1 Tax=Danio rerio TaxID=7955 RepID=A0AC58GLR1_DANRE